MKKYFAPSAGFVALSLLLLGLTVQRGYAHCQVPCGIYDDDARFHMIEEHLTTIEKAMGQIELLSSDAPDKNVNQLVRWVQTKEEHADEISHIVSWYFMTQKLKPVESTDKAAFDLYVKKLTSLHQMLVLAMKCKQTTDPANVAKLKTALGVFADLHSK